MIAPRDNCVRHLLILQRSNAARRGTRAFGIPSYGTFGVKSMETVSIVVITLLVAVVGRAILDPTPVR